MTDSAVGLARSDPRACDSLQAAQISDNRTKKPLTGMGWVHQTFSIFHSTMAPVQKTSDCDKLLKANRYATQGGNSEGHNHGLALWSGTSGWSHGVEHYLTAGCCDLCVVTCVCVCVTTSTYLNYDYLNCYLIIIMNQNDTKCPLNIQTS
jgi:hypothetical protein